MRIIASLLLVAALLSGCSSDDSGGDSSQTPTAGVPSLNNTTMMPVAVALTASAQGVYPVNPTLSPATMTVEAGAMVTLTFTNNDPNRVVMHNWVLEGVEGASTASAASGATVDVMFMAPAAPGEFAFYCSIGDHRSRGMEGTLTVE